MNKEMRLQTISRLISEHEIKTQEELGQWLFDSGLQVTQATISRDIRELKLIKVPSKDGSQKYSFKIDQDHLISEKLRHKLRDALVSMEIIQYFVIIKTLPGHAHAFGALLDSMEIDGKAGTICGNDTCLIICRSPKEAVDIKQKIDLYQE
ncbi:arginine repressor [Neobacillus sp. MM2021_6]|uniref:arginine repressor n=1 Tax=Bacillaceae TaxID=186817 RepID=UPI00140AA63B|nr:MULTISPECIES: arginine repressor [Bacillaceae]MBO0958989.1 arginine repressor [Neobacillus sp. MM2021_6]NHC17719.1 arginine repressor [Bacillus sp. MM2020_4]WML41109.1 arginine repressor [Neobacillus sp. OS1-2]